MRNKTKLFFIVLGLIFVVGLGLFIGGVSMGGKTYITSHNYLPFSLNWDFDGIDNFDFNFDLDFDFDDNNAITFDNEQELYVVGSSNQIQAIELDVHSCRLSIIDSDDEEISFAFTDNLNVDYSSDNNTLIIDAENDNLLSGLGLNIGWWNRMDYNLPTLTIYLPSSISLESFEADLEFCQVNIDCISANKQLFSASLASVTADNLTANTIELDCELSDMDVVSYANNEISINAELSDVSLHENSHIDDFSFTANSELGQVSINNETHSNSVIQNNNSNKTLTVDCELGNVDVIIEDNN